MIWFPIGPVGIGHHCIIPVFELELLAARWSACFNLCYCNSEPRLLESWPRSTTTVSFIRTKERINHVVFVRIAYYWQSNVLVFQFGKCIGEVLASSEKFIVSNNYFLLTEEHHPSLDSVLCTSNNFHEGVSIHLGSCKDLDIPSFGLYHKESSKHRSAVIESDSN